MGRISVNEVKRMPTYENAGKNFLHYTRYEFATTPDQMLGYPPPSLELPFDGVVLPLPPHDEAAPAPLLLTEAIEERCSVREYTGYPLNLAELSFLLWCTQGVKWVSPDGISSFRTVPSAGAPASHELDDQPGACLAGAT